MLYITSSDYYNIKLFVILGGFYMTIEDNLPLAIECLNNHHHAFEAVHSFAVKYGQPTPEDSRAWSQLLISVLTNINGPGRKKGPDLLDGSDVKAANTWGAIDTPRFNGVIKAGTLSALSGNMSYLDTVPYLYMVLWDYEEFTNVQRVRIWTVNCKTDPVFREMCATWYEKVRTREIISTNFQLHPPRNKNNNVIRNTCGNLEYPLLLEATWNSTLNTYEVVTFQPDVLQNGFCKA